MPVFWSRSASAVILNKSCLVSNWLFSEWLMLRTDCANPAIEDEMGCNTSRSSGASIFEVLELEIDGGQLLSGIVM
jgi:hypothetical protein